MRSSATVDTVSVIDRVTLVLGCFGADDRRLGVSELARRAALPKSTVSRLVSELIDHRYLERDGPGVRLGLRLFELGELATRPNSLRALAVEAMADLRDAISETVLLAVLDGADSLCLGVLHARGTPDSARRVGSRIPAHGSAAGRVMLAFSEPDDAAQAVATARLAPGASAALRADLAGIRQRGVALDVDPVTGRTTGVAAAILVGATPIAAIAASGRAGVFDGERVEPAVRAAALGLRRPASPRRESTGS